MKTLGSLHNGQRRGETDQLARRIACVLPYVADGEAWYVKWEPLLGIADRTRARQTWAALARMIELHPKLRRVASRAAADPCNQELEGELVAKVRHLLHSDQGLLKDLRSLVVAPHDAAVTGSGGGGEPTGGHRRLLSSGARLLAFVLLLVLSVVAVTIALLFPDASRPALRVFAVIVLSSVPGWLFLRFVKFRRVSIWEEYVLNLHRLGVDHAEHLPRPPVNSIYFSDWLDRGGPLFASSSNIYVAKFEAFFGKRAATDGGDDERTLSVDTLSPMLLATAIFAVGWVGVLFGPPLPHPGPAGAVHPPEPSWLVTALRFAFVGAYVFTLQLLVRRYFHADLRPSAYVSAVLRVVTGVIAAAVVVEANFVDVLIPGGETVGKIVAAAFVIGFFPLLGLQALYKGLSFAIRKAVPGLRNDDYPLSDLDGLNIWYEARLLEEGIEDMQNLVTANIVDLLLHTRVPVSRIVDWLDQALLYLHLPTPKQERAPGYRWYERHGRKLQRKREEALAEQDSAAEPGGLAFPSSSRDRLRRLGIRTAFDLEEAASCEGGEGGDEASRRHDPQSSPVPGGGGPAMEISKALNEDQPSAVDALLKTLRHDPTMRYVRKWKCDWSRLRWCPSPALVGVGIGSSGDGSSTPAPPPRSPSDSPTGDGSTAV